MLYGLASDPLGDSADPRRYVPVDTHERALEALATGIRDGRSPLLLVGVGGVGKTLLLRVLAEREQRSGHAAIFSPFLHLAPDEVARWLLHLLGRPLARDVVPDAALLAAVPLYSAPPMVVLVDEIQSAPGPSVQRLKELARAGGAKLSLVVAGSPGSKLDALLPVLEPRMTFRLPDALLPDELGALCDAILTHPALEPALRGLSPSDRAALLRAASGVPVLLKNELVHRAVHVALGTSTPAVEPEPTWPAWPAASELDPELERDPVRWSRTLAVDALDLVVWPTIRPPPAPTEPDAAPGSAAASPARGWEATVALGAALTLAIRQRVTSWERAARGRARQRMAELGQTPARVQAAALRLDTHLRPLLGRTLARARAIAAEARAIAADAGAAAAHAARAGVAALRGLRVGVRRLPARTLIAAAALLVLALAPLRDASRLEIPAVALGSTGAPPPVGAAPAAAPDVRVQVNARPWARIRVDGVDAGSTPLSHLLLASGPHDFEAEFPDGRVVRRRIEIGPEQRFVSLP